MTLSANITSPNSINPTSPFSNSNHSFTSNSPTSPDAFITSATYKKPTTKHITQLSTSSPAGIAIANQVTPERLASLLSITGPLAIRHITSNLSKQIQGFEKLSLSKQRRLIMSCLNKGDENHSIVFEKIGWGQWSSKKVDPADFVKERNLVRIANEKVKDSDHHNPQSENISDNNNNKLRRESITRNKYEADNHDKFLSSKQSNSTIKAPGTNEFAILSDDDEEDSSDFYDDDEEFFKFEDEESIPPLKLNNQSSVPSRISPPITSNSSSRRQSHSSSKISKIPIKNKRSNSNSQTPTSPELLYYGHSNNVPTGSRSRRHSSIRSTLTEVHPIPTVSGNYTTTNTTTIVSSSIPSMLSPQVLPHRTTSKDSQMQDQSSVEEDTDEEDWESIGALKLLKTKVFDHSIDNVVSSSQITEPNHKELKRDEQDAAFALVNLRSV